ncbi:MAG: hypothetical protein AB7V23_12965 [Candidatus Nanopelagicales bacterium]
MTAPCPLCGDDPDARIPQARDLGSGHLVLILERGRLTRWVRRDAPTAYRVARKHQDRGATTAVVPVRLLASPRAADRAFRQLADAAPPDLLEVVDGDDEPSDDDETSP